MTPGCFQTPVMLNFDDASVGGNASPSDGSVTYITSPLTYHGLTFKTSASFAFAIANQNYNYGAGASNIGYVSSPANNLFDSAVTSRLSALTISTGGNGAVKVISLFVFQPRTSGQSISITGSLNGANSPGCVGTFTPANGVGTAVQFSACVADTLIVTGNAATANGNFLVGIDTLLACAGTPTSALTATA